MPFLIPLIPLIAAGVGAAGTAYAGYQAAHPDIPATPPPAALDTKQSPGTNQAQQTAVSQALPNLQTLTGGSLSPEYAAQWGATQTGLSNNPQANGNIQAAINQFFGLTAPGQTGLTPSSSTGSTGGPGIIEMLAKATPNAGFTSGGGGMTQSMINDAFHGFAA